MPVAATSNGKRIVPEHEKSLSKLFADMFQSYLESSDEVQSAIHDMVEIMSSEDATEEERDMPASRLRKPYFLASIMGI